MSDASERRREKRTRTIQGAKVVYGDFRYVVDCVVRDTSATGVRLKVTDPAEIPDVFHLFDPRHSSLTPARSVWRTAREIGAEFSGEPIDIYTAHDPRLARFKHI